MLPLIQCAPNDFVLYSIQLELVQLHPHSYDVDARRYLLMELSGCCWTAEAIDLCIVGIHMWLQVLMLNQPQ